MIPLYGFLERDTIGLLVMANPQDTIADLIEKLQKSASLRVKPQHPLQFIYKKRVYAHEQLVQEIGFKPLEHFFVRIERHVQTNSKCR